MSSEMLNRVLNINLGMGAEGDKGLCWIEMPIHTLALNLENNNLGAEGAKGLCWMERMPALSTLTLNLQNNGLEEEAAKVFHWNNRRFQILIRKWIITNKVAPKW